MESDKKLLFKHVIEYFADAAIAIQTVFAAFWLFKNIGVLQADYVSHTYILAAESLKVDDSMGILYALIVRALGHGALLQIVQMIVLSASIFFFSLTAFEKRPAVTIALLSVTNPLILQAEMAVSPNALVVACALLAVAFTLKASASKWWLCGLFAVSVAAGFLNPDYAFLFFIAGAVYLLIKSIMSRKFLILLAVVCVAGFVIPVLTNDLIRDNYAYGRVHRSIPFLTAQRTVWPEMSIQIGTVIKCTYEAGIDPDNYDFDLMLRETDKIPEKMAMEFGYKYEHIVGVSEAQKAYRALTKAALNKGVRYWGKSVLRDGLLYFFTPVTPAVAYLKQRSDTSVPRGLDYLFNGSAARYKIYFVFSSCAGFLFTLMYVVKGLGERAIGKKEAGASLGFFLLGLVVLVSLYATLVCVREYDYRNVLFVIVAWPAAAIALTERKKAI